MFNYISEILKNFTSAQRILALLILVCTIVIITLGPSFIDSNTNNCGELLIRVKSQEEQIVQLNTRVNELNTQLLNSQKECTDNLVAKQKEIIDIVNGLIKDAESSDKPKKSMITRRPASTDEGSDGTSEMVLESAPPPPQPVKTDNTEMIKKLKTMKSKIETKFK